MQFSVFTVMLPDLTPEEAAGALREAGYDGVEWRVTHTPPEKKKEPHSFWGHNLCTLEPTQDDARRARSLAAASGLAMPSLGTYIPAGDVAATENAMQFAKTAGAPQIRVGVGNLEGGTYADRFSAAQGFLKKVEALALQHGVRAVVEIHPRSIAPSASAAYRLVAGCDPKAIGVIFDPGNMVHEGFEDYRLGTQLLGPYLALVHVKNTAYKRPDGGGVWQPVDAPMDDGAVDWGKAFKALRDVGYDGWLSFEDFSRARPSRDALRFNIEFIRRLLAVG